MIAELLSTLNSRMHPSIHAAYMVFAFFIGLFLFWRSVRRGQAQGFIAKEEQKKKVSLTKHQKESEKRLFSFHLTHISKKVLDMFFISLVFSVIFARLLYILYNPEQFVDARWFIIPYEKIEGQVYIMESFPWLFFKIGKEGLLVDAIIAGILISFFALSKVFRIQWKYMARAVSDFLWWTFVALAFRTAIKNESSTWLIVTMIVFYIGLVRLIIKKVNIKNLPQAAVLGIEIIWKITAILGGPVTMLIMRLSQQTTNVDLLLVINIGAVIIGAWMIMAEFLERANLASDARVVTKPAVRSKGRSGKQDFSDIVSAQVQSKKQEEKVVQKELDQKAQVQTEQVEQSTMEQTILDKIKRKLSNKDSSKKARHWRDRVGIKKNKSRGGISSALDELRNRYGMSDKQPEDSE